MYSIYSLYQVGSTSVSLFLIVPLTSATENFRKTLTKIPAGKLIPAQELLLQICPRLRYIGVGVTHSWPIGVVGVEKQQETMRGVLLGRWLPCPVLQLLTQQAVHSCRSLAQKPGEEFYEGGCCSSF